MLLKVQNLSYEIDNKILLKNINLSFNNGFYVLLGLNGAGKTTLMKILATLNKPTKGNVSYHDKNIFENSIFFKKDLSFLPQNIGLIQDFTVKQNLFYFGLLKGGSIKKLKNKIDNILKDLNLLSIRNTKIINLSGGIKQKIGIALALINTPKVLILDEPFNNLDKYEREKFYLLLQEISKNSIVILSTHLINEIENFCDNVIFMNNGKVSYFGNIKDSFSGIEFHIKNGTSVVNPTLEDFFTYYTKY